MKRKQAEKMAKYAYQKVPLYYRIAEREKIKIEDMDFESFPVVSKTDFIEVGMGCLSSEYVSGYVNGTLNMTRTSGSTGKFTEVYWDKKEEIRSLFSLWGYRKKYYGIMTTDKMCYFYPSGMGTEDFFEEKNFLGISKKYIYNGGLKSVYKKILEYNPIWMILQPSIAELLCNIADEIGKIPLKLEYIEFTGEYLAVGLRKRVEKIFNCKTANQYGTKEVNSIAYECPEGRLHCMTQNVYLEVYSNIQNREEKNNYMTLHHNENILESQKGELCVTSLQNRAMPLVRFRLGDQGKIYRNTKCPCGNKNEVLELIQGRSNDWIQMKDGRKIHSYAVIQIIHKLNYETDGGIMQYQIIQEDYKQFVVMLVMEEEYVMQVRSVIKRKFRERLGEEIEVSVRLFNALLPEERTGKLACFISNVKGRGVENR